MVVKKMRLDFSKVTERSGWNTAHIDEGLHLMKIVEVSDAAANDGTDMLTYALVPLDKALKTRRFPYFCKLQDNQYFKIRDLLVASGIDVPKKVVNFDPNSPVGKIVAAEVVDGRGNFSERSEINGIYDRSVIEDDDAPEADDDEGEEVDEDEVEDEELDDEEEDEEVAELREELEGLTLTALRKRAKGLGIATTGVKQEDLVELVLEQELEAEEEDDEADEDDDEDLGDDELDDEEFDDEEDEEEEPEPVKPARRSSAAAGRKPAAKPAAKAAPAKRVVKRR